MLSMTGYGRAFREVDGRQMTVEVKSVNHRFLDISFRMPRNLLFLEDSARKAIGAKLARGHVDMFVTYRNLRTDARKVTVDRALFEAYAGALESVADLGLEDDRTLMGIARMPDVMTVVEAEEDQQAVQALLEATLNEALDQLLAMRRREGEAMKRDLSGRVDAIERMTAAVEARYPETVAEYTQRLRDAVLELTGSAIDEGRLVMEVAIMADRSAIAEEIVRLNSHVQQLRALFESPEPIGRRIDFIVQELNREVNTISSKSQDIPITQLTVDLKSEIEKLREQLQNVE
ncbi:MAG: YicC/YloC family endoribonuclease [Clostridia bacterium]|nr:YicC/YloC family endoribonuclease [Clostridia bacterium]